MILNCRACYKKIPEEAIDSQKGLATCVACGRVQIAQSVNAKTFGSPQGLTWTEEEERLSLVGTTASMLNIGLLAISIIFTFLLAKDQPLFAAILFGGPALYFGFLLALNKYKIVLDNNGLRAWGTPLPSWIKANIDKDQIEQVYVKQHVIRNKDLSGLDKREYYRYSTHVATKSGPSYRITPMLPDADTCLFVEQKIEQFLGIEDQTHPGEMGYC